MFSRDEIDWLIDWLVHLYPPITRKRRCAMLWTNPHPLRSWPFSTLSCWRFDFFSRKFAACSKPPSRDNYRKASYPRTQQRDQGGGWTHDPAIRVVVKTTPLPIWPRCQLEDTTFEAKASDGVLETGLGSWDTFLKVSSRSRLGLELQISISSLGLEKLWSRNMRSLETQNLD